MLAKRESMKLKENWNEVISFKKYLRGRKDKDRKEKETRLGDKPNVWYLGHQHLKSKDISILQLI